jgi:hypothetical protein
MVKVYNKDTSEFLGRISETDLAFLAEQLEEEGLKDRDYYIRKETLEAFKSSGASAHLSEVLQGGLKNLDAIEIRWERDNSEE